MSLDAQLDRIRLCNGEISNDIKRIWRLQPSGAILLSDLPCLYALPLPLTDAVPNRGAGQYIVKRRIRLRLLVSPGTLATIDSGNDGAFALATTVTLLDAVIDYYMTHPRLHTDSGQRDLNGLHQDVAVTDEGPGVRPAPDGVDHIGADIILTFEERRQTRRVS